MTIHPITNHGKTKYRLRYKFLGAVRNKFFGTREAAEDWWAKESCRMIDEGPSISVLSDADRAEVIGLWLRMKELGVTPGEVLKTALEMRKSAPLVPDVVAECIESKRLKRRRPRYLKQLAHVLGHFASTFPTTQIDRISPTEIEQWIHLGDYADASRKSRFQDIRTLFAFAVKRAYCQKNPFDHIDPISLDAKTPGILRVKAAAKLMRVAFNRDRRLCRYLAMCLFAGIRPEEAAKLEPKHLVLDKRMIHIPAEISKTRKSRNVMLEDNALEWIQIDGDMAEVRAVKRGPVKHRASKLRGPLNLDQRFDKIRKQAGLFKNWPHDAMRHSAATYLYALRDDAAYVAKQLGNSVQIMLTNYNPTKGPEGKVLTKELAEQFFDIRPEPIVRILERAEVA
jgi:site-specific recombinase XerD